MYNNLRNSIAESRIKDWLIIRVNNIENIFRRSKLS